MSEQKDEEMATRKNSLFEQKAVDRILQQFGTAGELITRTRIWEDGANFGYDKGYHDAEEHYFNYQYAFENGEKKAKEEIQKVVELLFENGNLFFEDYEGKVSPITYCDIKDGKIIFKE